MLGAWNTTVGMESMLLAVRKCRRLLEWFMWSCVCTIMFAVVRSGIPPFRLNGPRVLSDLTAGMLSLLSFMMVVILLALMNRLVGSLLSMVLSWVWNVLTPLVLTAMFIVLVRLLKCMSKLL